MPMPLWWGKINKRLFNPKALENDKWSIVTHVGRSSGRIHRTPLGAQEADGTFVFILVYSSKCDWAQNVLASGSATLEHEGEVIELRTPRILSAAEAKQVTGGILGAPPGILNVDEYLQMDAAERRPATATADLYRRGR